MELNKVTTTAGKFAKIKTAIGFIIVGIIFVVLGILVIIKSAGTETTYVPVEATVVDLYSATSDEEQAAANLKYVVDGTEYVAEDFYVDKATELGDIMTIYYDANNPANASTDATAGKILPYVILVAGVLALAFGAYTLVKSLKTSREDMDQLNRVDKASITQEMVDEVTNNDEIPHDYYFHFCGTANQSYVLETTSREPVITMDCVKFRPLSAHDYTFTNKLNGKSNDYKISHTITESYGDGNGWNIPVKSVFKVDDTNVFDMIGSMGYSVTSKLEGIRLNFDIYKYGVKVATLVAGGNNILKDDKNYGKLGDIPTTGIFAVNAKESDLDAVALIAFAVSRVEFF